MGIFKISKALSHRGKRARRKKDEQFNNNGNSMDMKPEWEFNQSGVIPFRRDCSEIKILLITSRKGKRWVIPKGVIEKDLAPHESAVKEAFEEAGIRGHVYTESLGEYKYRKWGGVCTVAVFLFEVREELDEWPESSFRQRKWMTVIEAGYLVKERALKKMIRDVPVFVSQKM